MSPIDPLQNPVTHASEIAVAQTVAVSHASQAHAQSNEPTPMAHGRTVRLRKRYVIAPLMLFLIATPIAMQGINAYEKAQYEKSLIPKHRIVTL